MSVKPTMKRGPYKRRSLADRWAALVERGSGCWEWQGSRTPDGYGRINSGGRGVPLPAHRVSYELHVGPIPEGFEIDHLCKNPGCVNPAHLEAVTHKENIRRGLSPAALNARKTHCVNGHEFTSENTKIERRGRKCRTCANEVLRKNYQRQREMVTCP